MATDGQPEVTTELTATQYVILAENQRKKKALSDTKGRYNNALDENKALLKQLEENQREAYQVTEHLKREILSKNAKLQDLESELARTRLDGDDAVASLTNQASAREKKLLAEAAARQADMQATIDRMSTQLAELEDFRQRRVEVEGELLRLKHDNQQLKEQLEQQKMEMERYYIEQTTRTRKEYEQKLEELKKSAEEEIDDRLDASMKRILAQNRRMAEELKIHMEETDALASENKVLSADRVRLMQEVSLKTELEDGYAKRSAKQQTALRETTSKVAALESSLKQVMADFSKERHELQRSAAAAVADVQAEADALRRLVKLRSKELANIRRLAQEVLLQRSDVETFLLSSLHIVRKECERGSLVPGAPRTADSPLLGAAPAHDPGLASGPSLSIRDLSWEDREKVLRLLFAKINNQAQAQHFSNLPPHSFGPGGEGGVAGLHTYAGPASLA